MKNLLVLCAAVGVACVVTFLVVSSQKTAQFSRERELLKSSWDAERAELEAALRAAKGRPASAAAALAAAAPESAAGRSSAHDILEKLKKIKVIPGEQRNPSIRRIV